MLHLASKYLIIALALLSLASIAQGGAPTLVFVSQPILLDSGKYTDYSSIRMFTVDSNATLDSLWQSPTMKIAGIRVFPDAGTMLVQKSGGYDGIVQVYSTTDTKLVCEINPTVKGSTILRSHQYSTGEDLGLVAFDLILDDPKDPEVTVFVSPREVAKTGQVNGEEPGGELRLAGDWPNIGEKVDRVEFPDSAIVPSFNGEPVADVIQDPFPVPDSVVWIKSPSRWSVVAHEPTFIALSTLGYGSRELLTYSRPGRQWRSVLVAGNTNSVRPLNGWLIVEGSELSAIVDSGPETKFPERGKGSVILINPTTSRLIEIDLDGRPEVLWIEADTIYYHVREKLYRGRITDTGILDDSLLASDALVVTTHWAFRASKIPANRH